MCYLIVIDQKYAWIKKYLHLRTRITECFFQILSVRNIANKCARPTMFSTSNSRGPDVHKFAVLSSFNCRFGHPKHHHDRTAANADDRHPIRRTCVGPVQSIVDHSQWPIRSTWSTVRESVDIQRRVRHFQHGPVGAREHDERRRQRRIPMVYEQSTQHVCGERNAGHQADVDDGRAAQSVQLHHQSAEVRAKHSR